MFKVCRQKCNQCLFSKNRIVSKKRMAEVLEQCRRTDSHFECHKTEDVCCAGFYQADPYATNLMRIASRLGVVEFVEVPEVELETAG